MLKLYNFDDSKPRFWEAWDNNRTITVHWGTLGTRGKNSEVKLAKGQDADALINELSAEPRNDGFRELTEEEEVVFIIQYRLDTWGSVDDLDKRHQIEDLMNECLGWTGNGHCDGGDIGSGSINVWCFVADPHAAAKVAAKDLKKHKMLDGAVMAYRDANDDYVVVWPEDFDGEFSTI